MSKQAILGAILLQFVGGLPRAFAAESPANIELVEEAAIRSAVERIRPAVVRIDLIGTAASNGEVESAGPTTGLIVGSEGYVLTSAFAFSTPPASILITLDDARQSVAKLVAVDHSRQLALLKLEGEFNLQTASLAPRGELAVGQWAIAVGRALESDRPSVSVGILSALGRIQGKAVQTDAAISPTNYGGPLIDISGRAIGILTPLAPDDAGASGAEWYDSGIGFAVPLDGYDSSLERMKSGEDLHRGLIGIALSKGNAMVAPATISNIRRRGPADRAGLKDSDTISAINGDDTPTQATFRRTLGRYYAGDSIVLTVLRDKSELQVEMELVRELEPFRHVALGLMPKYAPDAQAAGIIVERLLPNEPAEAAGMEPNDRIVGIDDRAITSTADLAAALESYVPGDEVQLKIVRTGTERDVAVKLGERSAAHFAIDADDKSVLEQGDLEGSERELNLPEFAASCPLYVPAASTDAGPPGLLLVLQSAAESIKPEKLAEWQRAADRNNLILAMPGPQDGRNWSGSDLEYVKQLVRTLLEREGIARDRVALVGIDCPNRVTFATWLTNREIVRGVVLGSTEMPQRVRLPENELESPCLILFSASPSGRETQRLSSQFQERGFSTASEEELTPRRVAAWADTLDRL